MRVFQQELDDILSRIFCFSCCKYIDRCIISTWWWCHT